MSRFLQCTNLVEATVHGDRGETELVEELVECLAAGRGGDKDDDLVELESVEQVVQLAVLLSVSQRNLCERDVKGEQARVEK